MSCDIVSYAERLVHGHWLCVAHQPFDAQNYGFFGWLADVRNYAGMAPIAAYRGFPVYSSETVWRGWDEKEGHSTSWVLVSELLAVDYEQMVEDRRCTVQV